MRKRDIAKAPNRQRIFIGDETERPQTCPFQPARKQHAERLVREPALERIADEVIFGGAREGLDQQVAGLGSSERHCWISSHSRTWSRQRTPGIAVFARSARTRAAR